MSKSINSNRGIKTINLEIKKVTISTRKKTKKKHYIYLQLVRFIFNYRENHKHINNNIQERKGISQSNTKFKNQKKIIL